MISPYIVVAIFLWLFAAALFHTLVWLAKRRDKRRAAKAYAARHIADASAKEARFGYEAAARKSMQMSLGADQPPMQLDTCELKYPWFAGASRWEASRREFGPN